MSNEVGQRIKQLRTLKGLTQSALAELIGLTYIQVGRYEKGKSNPSSEVLQKLAVALDTSTDMIMNGSSNEQANNTLKDKDLLKQFKEVEQLPFEKRIIVTELIDAFLLKCTIQ